ncbi:hypothetical protein ACFXKC_46300 [Streptomyces sp. NPDC059340]|uniref:hypothetical protein n=1 Tax=Streptomyces sp. NPDC059340 TaxID=3346806 RepID=UPI00369AF32B
MKTRGNDEEKSRAAGRAAGYCWARNPNSAGRCTLQPGHDGRHVDHNNGRKRLTDTSGSTWA